VTIPAVLSGQQLSKRYGGIQALDQVDIDLYPGKVVALAGQNGAGKSTLVKIISGAVQPDSGVVLIDEVPLKLDSVPAAQLVGIRVVHQVPALALDLSVLDNIFLGFDGLLRRKISRTQRYEIATATLANITNTRIDLNAGQFSELGIPLTYWSEDFSQSWGDARTVAIAYGASIENATGGGGGDRLIGNALANVLEGRAGNEETAAVSGVTTAPNA